MQDINSAHTAQGQWPVQPGTAAPRHSGTIPSGPDRLRAVAAHLHQAGQGPSAMELEHFARELETVGVATPEPESAESAHGLRYSGTRPSGTPPLPPADLERLLASVRRGTLADVLGDIPVRITIDLNPRG